MRAVLVYAALIAALHHSLLADFGRRVLAGGFVGGIFVWEFSWFRRCLLEGRNPFFTEELFWPAGTPVIVETPLNILWGLVLQLGLDPYRSANLVFLFNYLASGAAMYWLCLRVSKDKLAAFVGGFLYMFSHYALAQHVFGHMHETAIYFAPLLFLAALEGRLWLLLGAAAGTALVSTYLSFETMLVGLPVFALAQRLRLPWRKVAAIAFAVGALGLFAYLPVLLRGGELIGGEHFFSMRPEAFFDYPAWHADPRVQKLRSLTSSADSEPETLIGFFGLTVAALLIQGWRKGAFKNRTGWLALGGAGILLSFGPWLGPIPMPYLVFSKLPLLSMFRAPSRMILLTWLAVSVLASLSYKAVAAGRPLRVRLSLAAAVLAAFSWEMGLGAIGRQWAALKEGPVYEALVEDAEPGAVLELPVSISSTGGISLNAEEFMLQQPRHGRPLVVGRPCRYTRSALAALEKTPLLYELTHPATLKPLLEDPKYAGHLRRLKAEGPSLLRRLGVRFVILHTDERLFDDGTKARYARLLDQTLGSPALDEGGRRLYRILGRKAPSALGPKASVGGSAAGR